MKKILSFIICACIALSFISCDSVAFAASVQYDDVYYTYEADYQTILVHGTPVYIDGEFAYYSYRNVYYYPYIWNNQWYLHPYLTVQPRGFVHRPRPGFMPNERMRRPHDFNMTREPHIGHRPGHYPDMHPGHNRNDFNRPNNFREQHFNRPNTRPDNRPSRPMQQMAPSRSNMQPMQRSNSNMQSSTRIMSNRPQFHGGRR